MLAYPTSGHPSCKPVGSNSEAILSMVWQALITRPLCISNFASFDLPLYEFLLSQISSFVRWQTFPILKSPVRLVRWPSFPTISTPTSATSIIETSFSPSPMKHMRFLVKARMSRATSDFGGRGGGATEGSYSWEL